MNTDQITTEEQTPETPAGQDVAVEDTKTTEGSAGQDQAQQAADDHPEPENPTEDTPLTKARAEAAQRRVALREAQDQNETLRAQVTALQDAALSTALAAHGVTLEAVKASGHRDAAFRDDGTVNVEALPQIAADVATRYGTTKFRRPGPDSSAGREQGPGDGPSASSWAAKLRG